MSVEETKEVKERESERERKKKGLKRAGSCIVLVVVSEIKI